MKTLLLTLTMLLVAAPAIAHERGEYNPDDPSTYACAVTPDNHRHVEDVCYDGHDLEDCAIDERDADGWCLSEEAPTYEPPPELEVIHDPEGITGEVVIDPDHEPEPFEVVHDPEGITGEPVVDPDHEPEPFEVLESPEPVVEATPEPVVYERVFYVPSRNLSYR